VNSKQRAFAKRLRKELKKVAPIAPTFYRLCYAPLSDEALLADMTGKAKILEAARGEKVSLEVQWPDGKIAELGSRTVPGKPENN
jgi:hypothetical protein